MVLLREIHWQQAEEGGSANVFNPCSCCCMSSPICIHRDIWNDSSPLLWHISPATSFLNLYFSVIFYFSTLCYSSLCSWAISPSTASALYLAQEYSLCCCALNSIRLAKTLHSKLMRGATLINHLFFQKTKIFFTIIYHHASPTLISKNSQRTDIILTPSLENPYTASALPADRMVSSNLSHRRSERQHGSLLLQLSDNSHDYYAVTLFTASVVY